MVFLESIADCYLNSYLKIATNRKNYEFNETEKNFQLIRRGRYAEFNLIYDRGTALACNLKEELNQSFLLYQLM